jgi:two-component system response regulator
MTSRLAIPVDIIVAEDDDDDYFFIERSFRKAHCNNTLARARDGEELMALLQERLKGKGIGMGTPHSFIVLLDLNMPKKDGREALKEMRAHPILRRVPVIVLTTSQSDEDIIKSYDLGVNCFLRKPASFDAFVEIMDRLNKFWFELVEIPAFSLTGK